MKHCLSIYKKKIRWGQVCVLIPQQLHFSATNSNIMVSAPGVGPVKVLNSQISTWVVHFGYRTCGMKTALALDSEIQDDTVTNP